MAERPSCIAYPMDAPNSRIIRYMLTDSTPKTSQTLGILAFLELATLPSTVGSLPV